MSDPSPHDWTYRALVLGVVAVALLFGLWLWRSIGSDGGADEYPISWFIIGAAIMGSVANESYRRAGLLHPTTGRIAAYLCWKSAVSIIFAFLLYLMLVAGLIGGDMFPKFVARPLPEGTYWNMQRFLTDVEPATHRDIAKILVWSFIAGYAERFVPNLVGRIIKSVEQEGAGRQA